MADLQRLMSEFEGDSSEEVSEIKKIIMHSKTYGDSELEDRAHEVHRLIELHRLITDVSEKVYDAEDPDYISALDSIHNIEKQRERISEDLINFLEEVEEYAISNEDSDGNRYVNAESVRVVINKEKQARKIESEIESDLLKEFRRKAYEQAKEIIREERFHVKFRHEALQDFLEFAYSKTFEDPVLEAFGAFNFDKVNGENGRDFDILIEEFIPCRNYDNRERDAVNPSDEFLEKVQGRDDLVTFHTHPPGSQKSHSGLDKHFGSRFNILGVPESKNKVWVAAQSKQECNWINHAIEVVDGQIPQAHLEKYNEAIIKSLAHREMDRRLKEEYGNWETVEQELGEDTVHAVDKRTIDEKLDDRVNRGGEKQWLRFVKGEEY